MDVDCYIVVEKEKCQREYVRVSCERDQKNIKEVYGWELNANSKKMIGMIQIRPELAAITSFVN
jgi:hypothetical protein